MTAAAIENWNQLPAMPAQGRVAPMSTNPNGQDTSSGSGSASVTANDFLTLLVTEMKNQDPTANTDPNEYINQLVQVNSLQQLISINDTLTNSLGTGPSPDAATHSGSNGAQLRSTAAETSPIRATADVARSNAVGGNVSLPPANRTALGVASALSHK
jgi:flagellar basal-body rod modification protein FlgD